MRIRWLRKARINLEDPAEYLYQQDPQIAARFIEEVIRLTDLLSNQPELGRPGRVESTRELIIIPYPLIIPYRVTRQEIQILRVFRTRRRLPYVW